MKLYIIGNGFDLYHYLPSSYHDFKNFIKEKNKDLFEIVEESFNYEGTFWHAFETNLGELNEDHLLDRLMILLGSSGWNANALESFESNIEYYTIDTYYYLKNYMIEWAKGLNSHPLYRKHLDIESHSIFISFNYTDTLERYYNVNPNSINYIHGNAKSENCNLILGHDNRFDMNYGKYNDHAAQGMLVIDSFFKETRKPVEKIIEDNQNFWEKLSSVNEVIIIGHSLSNVDLPYFKIITKYVNSKCLWKVSYYNKSDSKKHITSLIQCGISRALIESFDIYPGRPVQGVLF